MEPMPLNASTQAVGRLGDEVELRGPVAEGGVRVPQPGVVGGAGGGPARLQRLLHGEVAREVRGVALRERVRVELDVVVEAELYPPHHGGARVVRVRAKGEPARGDRAVRVARLEGEVHARTCRRQRNPRYGQGPERRQAENDGGPSLRVGPVGGTSSAHWCPLYYPVGVRAKRVPGFRTENFAESRSLQSFGAWRGAARSARVTSGWGGSGHLSGHIGVALNGHAARSADAPLGGAGWSDAGAPSPACET